MDENLEIWWTEFDTRAAQSWGRELSWFLCFVVVGSSALDVKVGEVCFGVFMALRRDGSEHDVPDESGM